MTVSEFRTYWQFLARSLGCHLFAGIDGTLFRSVDGRLSVVGRDRHVFQGSSRISSGVYNPKTQTVELHFPDGTVVDYFDVPSDVWADMKQAPSAGRFLREVLEGYSFRAR
jgi:hypothetical protein